MCRGALCSDVCMNFLERDAGTFGRCDRIAPRLGRLIFVGAHQGSPRFDQMPFEIVAEHYRKICARTRHSSR